MPPTPMHAWLSFEFGEIRRGPAVSHPEKNPAADAAADAAKNVLRFIAFMLNSPLFSLS
jgi:hypothetical protein